MPPRAKTVNLEEIADLFGVTTETIRLWRKDGMPSRMQSGRPVFVVRECVTWRRDKDRDEVRDATAPDEAAERARKVRADANIRELEYAEMRGELVTKAAMQEMAEKIIGGFAAVATGQLTRFERDWVRCQSAAEARTIRDRVQYALMEGARGLADTWEAEADALEEAA